jgi:hypothetical protein
MPLWVVSSRNPGIAAIRPTALFAILLSGVEVSSHRIVWLLVGEAVGGFG